MTYRLTQQQRLLLEAVNYSANDLASHYLFEGGAPFDFGSIYYRMTGDFDHQSHRAASMRRTLRLLESKGQLIRANSYKTQAGDDNYDRVVATWHLPETFVRDIKFIQALPFISEIKHQSPTNKTPRKLIKNTFLGERVDCDWLHKPLVDWLEGKTSAICLPGWVVVPQPLSNSVQYLPEKTVNKQIVLSR